MMRKMSTHPRWCGVCLALVFSAAATTLATDELLRFSGRYPHLAAYNTGGECGTGALVPWAGRLWFLTYSPHQPGGSDDKLYEIDEPLNLTIRPESIGGTPAKPTGCV